MSDDCCMICCCFCSIFSLCSTGTPATPGCCPCCFGKRSRNKFDDEYIEEIIQESHANASAARNSYNRESDGTQPIPTSGGRQDYAMARYLTQPEPVARMDIAYPTNDNNNNNRRPVPDVLPPYQPENSNSTERSRNRSVDKREARTQRDARDGERSSDAREARRERNRESERPLDSDVEPRRRSEREKQRPRPTSDEELRREGNPQQRPVNEREHRRDGSAQQKPNTSEREHRREGSAQQAGLPLSLTPGHGRTPSANDAASLELPTQLRPGGRPSFE